MGRLRVPSHDLNSYHFFRPLLKAYGLGFLYFLGPRILSLVLSRAKRDTSHGNFNLSPASRILDILRKSFEIHRFPAFCGMTIGGWHVLQPLFEKLLDAAGNLPQTHSAKCATGQERRRIATFLASTSAAAAAIRLLNSHAAGGPAGRTLDLTLFAVVRALDAVIGEIWARRKIPRVRSKTLTRLESGIENKIDPVVFAASAAIIMFAWVYNPEKLPSSYNKWIAGFADIDSRLITTLRRIRSGEFVYGQDTGQTTLLEPLCEELNLPKVWGNPAVTKPLPCKLVHSGFSQSCELHACWRFWNAWKAAFTMYLGLNFLVRLRKGFNMHSPLRAIGDSAKSAAFLGTFVGTFWYTICLTRTRAGPFLWPKDDQLFLDKQCVRLACLSCGWSILVESVQRRAEIAFFVAPRALGTFLPRKYDRKHLWAETLVFAVSTGIVMTALKENPKRVRGVFGRVLGSVLSQ